MDNFIFAVKTILGAVLDVSGIVIFVAIVAAVRYVMVNRYGKEN